MQHKILKKTQLSEHVFQFIVLSPLIAKESQAGQFIILQIDEWGERIPLTIADKDENQGSITLIFQVVGKTTSLLSLLNQGDHISHLVGPLGKPTHIKQFGTVVCVAGGIGVAPMYPIAKAMKQAGNRLITIIGARTQSLLILTEEMKKISDACIICTDDGSFGRKDLVTAPLKEICDQPLKPNLAVAIGPAVMMKYCAQTTRPYTIPTVVSLNTIMVDGTGMCGGCRVSVGTETKFVCVDGPEFDGHLVDFDNMINRLNTYHAHEHHAFDQCKLQQTSTSSLRKT